MQRGEKYIGMNNRTQKSARNMTVGMISQLLTILLSFISRTVFIHFLSSEYLGINGLLANVLTVLSFAELGIADAMTYAMYKPAKEDDRETINKLMILYRKLYTIIAAVVGGIGLFLSFFINHIVATPPDIPESLQVIFWFYIVNNMASYLLTYKKSILIANQENYIVTSVCQVTAILQQIFQMLILWLTHQYYLYLLIQIICTVSNNIGVSVIVKKRYPWLNFHSKEKLPNDTVQSIYKNVKSLSVSKIAGVISNGADNIIISKLLGLKSVGLVSNYTLVINSLNGVLWSGLSSITSSFGNFNVDSPINRRRELFDELFLCSYWLYGFLTVGVSVLINPFIELWIGNAYRVPQSVAASLILITYISGLNFPVFTYQTTLGMYQKMKYPYLLFGVLNIFLSVVLGKKFGLIGVYLATSVSRLCTSEVAGGYYVYRDGLQLPPCKYAVKYVLHFVILIINIVINRLIISNIHITGIAGFIVKVMICAIVCNLVYLICFHRTKAFIGLKNRAIGLIKIKG